MGDHKPLSGYYPVATGEAVPAKYGPANLCRAMDTGEFRPPREGEWFLSGGVVEAYRAVTDRVTMQYRIARLVPGELVWIPLEPEKLHREEE